MTLLELIERLQKLAKRVDDTDMIDVEYEVDDNGNTAPIIDMELRDLKVILK